MAWIGCLVLISWILDLLAWFNWPGAFWWILHIETSLKFGPINKLKIAYLPLEWEACNISIFVELKTPFNFEAFWQIGIRMSANNKYVLDLELVPASDTFWILTVLQTISRNVVYWQMIQMLVNWYWFLWANSLKEKSSNNALCECLLNQPRPAGQYCSLHWAPWRSYKYCRRNEIRHSTASHCSSVLTSADYYITEVLLSRSWGPTGIWTFTFHICKRQFCLQI